MVKKVMALVAIFIAFAPGERIRAALYRILLGYELKDAKIGFGTVIAVDSAIIHGARIGRFNKFLGPYSLRIDAGVQIGNSNTFSCGAWAAGSSFLSAGYARSLCLSEGVLVTEGHHFDVVGAVKIGRKTWIGGRGSQFWTHGAGVVDHDILIGENCYIASACRFAPGSAVGDNCIVGLGSVVTGKFKDSNSMIAGVPAAVIKRDYDWRSAGKA